LAPELVELELARKSGFHLRRLEEHIAAGLAQSAGHKHLPEGLQHNLIAAELDYPTDLRRPKKSSKKLSKKLFIYCEHRA